MARKYITLPSCKIEHKTENHLTFKLLNPEGSALKPELYVNCSLPVTQTFRKN